ncbi:MAG: hypothetical protein HXN08_05125 [Porphyromonadaceae bacterium]|nr:hypothetical protein [Porphyromonadaceae bacterium]
MRDYAARYEGARLIILTFVPYPADVLRSHGSQHIDPPHRHLERLGELEGFEVVPMVFSAELAAHSAETFIREVLHEQLHVTDLFLGYDNRFGAGAKLAYEDYKALGAQYGMEVIQADSLSLSGEVVSSTAIKSLIRSGEMREAHRALGRPYAIYGTVVAGQKLGRRLGYPTANVQREDADQLLPPDGVYACDLELLRPRGRSEQHHAMLYIGKRPTLGGELERTIEVHILDFDEMIYGMEVIVHIFEQLHPEHRFASTEELRSALETYEQDTRRYFAENTRY